MMGMPGRTDDHQWSQQHLSIMSRESCARAPATALTATHGSAWIARAASARCAPLCMRPRASTDSRAFARPRRSSTGCGWLGPAAHPRPRTPDAAAGRAACPRSAETEASLLADQAGDVSAFERLSGAYADRLYMLLLRLLGDRSEAEDVAQEVMLRAWQGIARFQGRSSYFTWLYRIAVNEASRALEKKARRPAGVSIGAHELQLPASSAYDPSGRPRTANCAGPSAKPWASCRPRCGPPSCCVMSRGSPRKRPPRSPASARPPSKPGCTRPGYASGPPSATMP